MPQQFWTIARQGQHRWQDYVASIAVLLAIFGLTILPISLGVYLWFTLLFSSPPEPGDIESLLSSNLWVFTVCIALGMGGLLIGLFLSVKYVHRRPFLTLVNASGAIRWYRLCLGFIVWLGLWCLNVLFLWLIEPSRYDLTRDLDVWLRTLLPGLLTMLFSGAFSGLFYGYLLQAASRVIRRSHRLAMAVGLLMGLAALTTASSGDVDVSLSILMAGFAGWYMVWLVIQDDRLELVLGIYLASALFSGLLLGTPNSPWPFPQLLTINQSSNPVWGYITYLIRAGLFYLICFRPWLNVRQLI